MTRSFTPRFVPARDGVKLAVYEAGNPHGPEILFVHGFAQSHLCFARQFDSLLARDFRLITYDVRGHGASDQPAEAAAYSAQDIWANDLEAVMDAVQVKRPVLVGWSMGGRAIRQYLMAYGAARLAGVNFVSSWVIEDPRGMGALSPQRGASVPQTLAERLAGVIAFLDACFEKKPDEAEFRMALAYNMLVPFRIREVIAQWKTDPAQTSALLGELAVPVLVTHGRKDVVTAPAAAEMTAACIPGARLSWYDNCGHSPFWEEADRFNGELAAFVRSVQ